MSHIIRLRMRALEEFLWIVFLLIFQICSSDQRAMLSPSSVVSKYKSLIICFIIKQFLKMINLPLQLFHFFVTLRKASIVLFSFQKVVTDIQWSPLNGITLGPRQTDSINRMIPSTDTHLGWLTVLRQNRPWIPLKIHLINQMIPLTVVSIRNLLEFNTYFEKQKHGNFYTDLSVF